MDIIIKAGSTGLVEVIPQEDGSIIIRVNEQKRTAPITTYKLNTKPSKSNAEILKSFCSGKKEDPDINLKELKAFYAFYSNKADDWKGKMDCERLWERWMETVR